MNTLRDIIRQAQRELYCNTCRRSFDLEEIRFKGQLEKRILLQTVCMNQHPPTIMIFMAPYSGGKLVDPVNVDDVIALHKGMQNYRGSVTKMIKEL